MNEKQLVKTSKFLSLVLRHNPGKINVVLDKNGWLAIPDLLNALKDKNISMEDLEYIVSDNNKKRFEFDLDKKKIRACQGHSINIDLDLKPSDPPEILYHGTASKNTSLISKEGIIKGKRNHVHLSYDKETAIDVGRRHGSPVVYLVDAKKMHEDGILFFLSKNNVWLTNYILPKYITLSL